MRMRARAALGLTPLALAAAGILVALTLPDALAQPSPFGVGRAPAPPPPSPTGVTGWIIAKQGEFYRQFSGLIRAAKADGSAVWTLLGVSFLYGIFHAAGPGHGKAVISSYLIATDETWWRGIVLSFASALLQAIVAIAFVGIAAILLNATAATMRSAVWYVEAASYALIALIGARLLWVKGRAFLASLMAMRQPALAHAHGHHHEAHNHHHGHDHAHHHDHGHHHDHEHASAWGHGHGPEPEDLAGPGGWTRGLSAIVAVGLRPCSGAVLVLVFALAQGLFWAGVAGTLVMALGTAITVAAIATIAVAAKSVASRFASTGAGWGTVFLRGVETAASILILAFGVLLLFGYLASERMLIA
jgi:nickel/cobalt transporter (NicO) family protein